MAGNDVTLARLRHLLRPPTASGAAVPTTSIAVPTYSGPSSTARANTPPVGPTPEARIMPKQGMKVRSAPEDSATAKRQRTEGPPREFSAMDRSFYASRFIAARLLGPKAQKALRDYDPVESIRWAQWALPRSATIMKSVEPRLTMMDKTDRKNRKHVGDLKALNLQKVVLEEQLVDAAKAKEKVDGDVKTAEKFHYTTKL
ncbi:hypothetical protein PIB30_041151 [Stylosanthes scabra]|uniref:Uncharacterized protein n=1 Tax=Stylosanthes scabra TaxID=79078 RepID=A0ABU6TEN3_9FABA|nr:hypothetical protein [Stylosanthes scabra]